MEPGPVGTGIMYLRSKAFGKMLQIGNRENSTPSSTVYRNNMSSFRITVKKNFHKREREMLNQKKIKNRKSNTFLDDPEVVRCKWHVKSKVCSSDNNVSSNICDYSSP